MEAVIVKGVTPCVTTSRRNEEKHDDRERRAIQKRQFSKKKEGRKKNPLLNVFLFYNVFFLFYNKIVVRGGRKNYGK